VLAQPQVQKAIRRLATDRRYRGDQFEPELTRLAEKLRGFFTPEQLRSKVKALQDPNYPDE
jgi:hypothetical protein